MFGDEACFFHGYVGEERDNIKTHNNVRLTEANVLNDVYKPALVGDVMLCEAAWRLMEKPELVSDLLFAGQDNTSLSVPTTPEQLVSKAIPIYTLALNLILTKSISRSYKPSRMPSYRDLTQASKKTRHLSYT